ncbi:CHAT domain-containing protein [Dolichospermum circinale CS-534/05]|uniref:CHAT domain-containing protein n=1 Tax=Dolichospermum circinale TaxID=109265 RepID=UPI00232E9024|nr:CHAT domain-containing protein [Dolichospermum circinale]MDB9491033.1 CHAT domain-containing protein [Dolichospermum circinale CS-534/05]
MLNLVLKVNSGGFNTGFSGELLDDSSPATTEFTFPASPEIPQLYKKWQDGSRENTRLRLTSAGDARLTSHLKKCEEAKRALEDCSQKWFRDGNFYALSEKIKKKIPANETVVRINLVFSHFDVNKDDNDILRRLPWQLWRDSLDLSDTIKSTFALSGCALSECFSKSKKNSHDHGHVLKSPVKILAIFGSDENGLNQQPEKEQFYKLKNNNGVRVQIEEKPNRDRVNELLWHSKWDILFFSGHSSSQERTGTIQINDSDSLSLNDLKSALKESVEKGLKIAIFNSCDGLGIANVLTQVKVPAVIVMKEPVPDSFASKFFLNFGEEFVKGGQQLSLAVCKATQMLEIRDSEFPGATWLPVIYYSHRNQPDYICPTPGVITRLLTFLFKFFSPRLNVIKTGVSKIINTFKSKKILFGLTVIVTASIIIIAGISKLLSPTPSICKSWNGVIHSIEFTPDGKYLATSSLDNTLRVFEIDRLKPEDVIKRDELLKKQIHCEEERNIVDLSFSSDNKYLAVADMQSTINVLRLPEHGSGKLQELKLKSSNFPKILSSIVKISFSKNNYLAAANISGQVELWQIQDQEVIKIKDIRDQGKYKLQLRFSSDNSDNNYLVMSDVTGNVFGWDLKKSIDIDLKNVDITVIQVINGKIYGKISSCKKYECNNNIKPKNSQIESFKNIIPSPNGKYMAVIGNDNKNEYVELWEQKNQSWTKIEIKTNIDTKTITDVAFWQKDNKTSLIVATTNDRNLLQPFPL